QRNENGRGGEHFVRERVRIFASPADHFSLLRLINDGHFERDERHIQNGHDTGYNHANGFAQRSTQEQNTAHHKQPGDDEQRNGFFVNMALDGKYIRKKEKIFFIGKSLMREFAFVRIPEKRKQIHTERFQAQYERAPQ